MNYLKYIGAAIVALLTIIGLLKKKQIEEALEGKHEADKQVANLDGQIDVFKDLLAAEAEKRKALEESLKNNPEDEFDQDNILDELNRKRDH